MGIIYEPKGKAREYSPLAANFYEGCDHGCAYCYAPGIRRMTRECYSDNVKPRMNLISELTKDMKEYTNSQKQVLFNFMGDPYCYANDKYKLTREALGIMLRHHVPVAILTKGGSRALQDADIIKQFGDHIKVGSTLTFISTELSKEWEQGAAIPSDRLAMLESYHSIGIKTWGSFEPVIDPQESLKLIEASLDFVDEYKIGKINNYGGIDKTIDWTAFLESVVSILREAKKPFYIKYDLRQAAPSVKLYGNEVLPDEHCVKPWPIEESKCIGLFD
jgi:DNA repair photolyase